MSSLPTLNRKIKTIVSPFHDLPDRIGAPISCHQGISMLSNLPDAELVYLMMNQKVTLSAVVAWMSGSERSFSLGETSGPVKDLIEELSKRRSRITFLMKLCSKYMRFLLPSFFHTCLLAGTRILYSCL